MCVSCCAWRSDGCLVGLIALQLLNFGVELGDHFGMVDFEAVCCVWVSCYSWRSDGCLVGLIALQLLNFGVELGDHFSMVDFEAFDSLFEF